MGAGIYDDLDLDGKMDASIGKLAQRPKADGSDGNKSSGSALLPDDAAAQRLAAACKLRAKLNKKAAKKAGAKAALPNLNAGIVVGARRQPAASAAADAGADTAMSAATAVQAAAAELEKQASQVATQKAKQAAHATGEPSWQPAQSQPQSAAHPPAVQDHPPVSTTAHIATAAEPTAAGRVQHNNKQLSSEASAAEPAAPSGPAGQPNQSSTNKPILINDGPQGLNFTAAKGPAGTALRTAVRSHGLTDISVQSEIGMTPPPAPAAILAASGKVNVQRQEAASQGAASAPSQGSAAATTAAPAMQRDAKSSTWLFSKLQAEADMQAGLPLLQACHDASSCLHCLGSSSKRP